MIFPQAIGRIRRHEPPVTSDIVSEREIRCRHLPGLARVPCRRTAWTAAALIAGLLAISILAPPSPRPVQASPGSTDVALPLHTAKGEIVDAAGNTVTLTGVNWFGFETSTFAPDGLSVRNYKSMLDQIVASGFNAIRLPYCNALFRAGDTPNGINYSKNPDLKGLAGLALMDKIINAATSRGLMVILDQHRPDQNGQSELPYTGCIFLRGVTFPGVPVMR